MVLVIVFRHTEEPALLSLICNCTYPSLVRTIDDSTHMASTASEEPYYAFIISPQEEAEHKTRLLAEALLEQREQERQRQEDAEFKKQLDDKNLAELMLLQKHQREEAKKTAAALERVTAADMSVVTPYMSTALTSHGSDNYYIEAMSNEDVNRIVAVEQIKHIRDDLPSILTTSFSPVKEGDPMQQLEERKKWLEQTFTAKPTDAILVKLSTGENVIVSIGVSDMEVDAAKALQNDQRRAEERSAEITGRIQEKILEGSRKEAAFDPHEPPKALSTPTPQQESVTRLYNV